MQILILIIGLIFLAAFAEILNVVLNIYLLPYLFGNAVRVNFIEVFLFLIFLYYLYVFVINKENKRFAKFREKFYK